MSSPKKPIGILGGSFNPPHVGHVQICRYLIEREVFKKIMIIPCFKHPFNKPLLPFEDRIKMCELAFGDFGEDVIVSDIEKRLGGISHTVKTIEKIKSENQNQEFALIVGSDISKEKKDWKDFEKIQEMVKIEEVPRGNGSPITDISSTQIREMIKKGEMFDKYVPGSVAEYIKENNLYK